MLFQNHKGLIYLGISKNYQSVKGALVFSFGLPHISMRVSSPLQHLSLFLHPASVSSSIIFFHCFSLMDFLAIQSLQEVPVSYHMSEKACWQSRILVVPACIRLLHSTSLLFVRLPDLDSILEDGLNIAFHSSLSCVDGDAIIFWYSILFSGN